MYFNCAQAKSAGGRIYVDVYVQHSISISNIWSNYDWWLNDHNMGIYNRKLQVRRAARMGWLIYFNQALDEKVLASEIEVEIGVAVNRRYRYISTDKYELDKEIRNKWMALHLGVDDK